MRKLIFIIPVLLCVYATYAQNSGRGFNFQAVARDANGNTLASQNIELKFSIIPNSTTSNADWVETQVSTTDQFGVFAVIIGKGIKAGGTLAAFNLIDFKKAEYFLKIEIKQGTLYNTLITQALLSVPYAEYATTAGSAIAANSATTANTATTATNANYATTAGNGVQIGTIIPYAGITTTTMTSQGWLLCDGAAVSKAIYPDLWTAIGEIWGYGNDGENGNSFSLPDLRGVFLRGVNGNRSDIYADPDITKRTDIKGSALSNGNIVGSYQQDEIISHRHYDDLGTAGAGGAGAGLVFLDRNDGQTASFVFGGNETRPKNVNVNYIIKVK